MKCPSREASWFGVLWGGQWLGIESVGVECCPDGGITGGMAGDSWRDKGCRDNCIGIKGLMGMNEEIEDEGWRRGQENG